MKIKKELIKQNIWIIAFFLFAGIGEVLLLIILGIEIIPVLSGVITFCILGISLFASKYNSRRLLGIFSVVKFNPFSFFLIIAMIELGVKPFAENLPLYYLQLVLLISIGVISFILGIVMIIQTRKVMILKKQDVDEIQKIRN